MKNLLYLLILIIFVFTFQACEHKTTKHGTTNIQVTKPVKVIETAPVSTQIAIPTEEVVNEFYDAIFNNDIAKAKEMLVTNFPPNYQPKNKIAPLQAVIWQTDDVDLAKLLIDGGAIINHKDKPAVLIATEYKRLNILKYLIDNGADFKNNGAFNNAGFYQFYDGAKLLLLNGATNGKGDIRGKFWVFLQAIELADYEVLNALKLTKADLDYNNCDGKTALIMAIKKNDIEMVKYLIKKGADKNKPETFDCGDDISYGKKPMQIATENNFEQIVKLLK